MQVLDIAKENHRLSLGQQQLEVNPWDVFETIFTAGSIHEGTIIELFDKGAVVSLPYGVEGFATPKHLVKEDNTEVKVEDKLEFKVIEFNKDAKRIIVSHSRIHEDSTGDDSRKKGKRTGKKDGALEAATATSTAEKTTLGDIEELAALKEKLDNQKVEAFKKEAEKKADEKEADAEAVIEEVETKVEPIVETETVVEETETTEEDTTNIEAKEEKLPEADTEEKE